MPLPRTDLRGDYWKGSVGSGSIEVYRLVQTVAAWLTLAEVTNSISYNRKNGSTSAVGRS